MFQQLTTERHPKRSSPIAVTAFIAAALFFICYSGAVVSHWMVDDAFISFRYAANWAAGFGPVYNPGDAPVEGYTNFLWMALLALGARLCGDPVSLARLLGGAAGLLTLLLLYYSHRLIRGLDRSVSVIAALLLATCCLFLPWPLSGMETTLFGLLLSLSLLLHFSTLGERPSRKRLLLLGMILALTAMTRPEGFLVAALVLADQTLESLLKKRWQVFFVCLAFLLFFLPWFFWRWSYYGALLPNTFYAKVGVSEAQTRRGWQYFWRMYKPARFLIMAAMAAVLVPWVWLRRLARYYLLPLLLLLYTVYIIRVGGDGLPAFRFFAPLAAPLCLLAALGIRRIIPYRPVTVCLLAFLLMTNLYQAFSHPECYNHVKQGDYVHTKGTLVGQWLRDHAPEGITLATNTAGTIPYYSRLKTVDMLGLNDAHIARKTIGTMGQGYAGHEKGDGAYVLSLKPDLIQFSSSSGSERPSIEFIGDQEIFRDPAFKKDYRLKEFEMSDGSPLFLYVREDSPFLREEEDLLFDDFESGSYENWKIEGDCFGNSPVIGTLPGQRPLQGYTGERLINTLDGNVQSTGIALSNSFVISHNYIQFLLGGGFHPHETVISLLVDGEAVLSKTPKSSNILLPESWQVSQWLGREAQIEIKDLATGKRGFILVDQIVFSNTNRSAAHYARRYTHARFGFLPWLLLGAGIWISYALRRRTPLHVSEKLLPWVVLLFFVVLYRTAWVCDDACISMRTVHNFTNGLGLTWNIGERVQAYTHPLWMFLVSAVYYFSQDLYLTLIVLSMVTSLIALCMAAWWVAPRSGIAIAGLLILMFSRAFTDFSSSGLENPLAHLLLAVFMILYLRIQWTPALLFFSTLVASLIVLTRMDLSLLAAPAVLWMWLSLRDKKSTALLILAGMPVVLWILFSLIYYGFPFPNTAYAKLGSGVDHKLLMQQSIRYYMHCWSKDPGTLIVIVLGAVTPFILRKEKYAILSIGIILYLIYIVRIGGDFMGNRFFAAPCFLAVLILMRMAKRFRSYTWVPVVCGIILISSYMPHVPLFSDAAFGSKWESPISRYGICNERQYYYNCTGLLHWRPEKIMPRENWGMSIIQYAMLDVPLIRMYPMIGFQGYFSGPKTILIDPLALSDPLLSRLPAIKTQELRIGHMERHIPDGYLETRFTGKNLLKDPQLAAFYDKLYLLTQAPLFTKERWKTIVNMQLKRYDHLIDWEFYKDQMPDMTLLE
ncbi:MAG: glycosyltransferase family 39 protein [Candidatus Hydrogenedentales bacterium]|jgi:arabinofuranosyltransferase